MKTHEFARHLEHLARLLRQLPNTELDAKSMSAFQGTLPGINEEKIKSNRQPRPLPFDIEVTLSSMSPAEIETFLLSDNEVFTVANLSVLADQIGLTSSKRQSKIALVNMIARHYEARNMHSIMRSTKPSDSGS